MLAGICIVFGIGALSMGVGTGLQLLGCAGFFLLLILLSVLLKKRSPHVYRPVSRMLACVLALGVLAFGIGSVQIISRYADEAAPAGSVMIVLGCGLSSVDQTSPSLVLGKRLAAAAAYLDAHPEIEICVLSGGQGRDERISEAEAMYRYLTRYGIDESRLHKEEASTSTMENMAFTKDLLIEKGLIAEGDLPPLVVVTDGFHEFRAQYLAGKVGFECYTVASKTPPKLIGVYWMREVAGILLQVWPEQLASAIVAG